MNYMKFATNPLAENASPIGELLQDLYHIPSKAEQQDLQRKLVEQRKAREAGIARMKAKGIW